ncbi:MAG: DUF5615 family PIN-like protein [Opitutaceae bacterium]
MKLLFDQNLSFRLVVELKSEFPGSAQVRALGLDAESDERIWSYAAANGYVVVSKDEDFANRAALRGPPPKVIWIRTGNGPWKQVCDLLRRHARHIEAFGNDPTLACLELY